MISKWIGSDFSSIPMIFFSGLVVYIAILAYTRLSGLRSFSKMSASDFAMTVAVGSLFGSIISQPEPNLLMGLSAIAFLFMGQWTISVLRRKFSVVSTLVDNKPILLMKNGEFLNENLKEANITKTDIIAKLRESNVLQFEQVLAVVFETTGDISVLHTNDPKGKLEPGILENVTGR